MKFSVGIPGATLFPPHLHGWEASATPLDILRVIKKADDLGFDYISVPDHVLLPDEGLRALGPRWPHALATAGFVLGATRRIRVLNSIVVVPYHNPMETAQMIASIDFFSGGRFTCGFGVGNLKREFELLGANFEERGPVTDEYIDAMIELWTSDRPSFKGKYVQFDKVTFDPKPAQRPHPPIFIGGYTRPALRRIARVGDGWLPYGVTRKELPAMLDYVRSQPEYQRRFRGGKVLELSMPLFEAKIERATHTHIQKEPVLTRDNILGEVDAIRRLGATMTGAVIKRSRNLDEYIQGMEWFAQEVLSSGRK